MSEKPTQGQQAQTQNNAQRPAQAQTQKTPAPQQPKSSIAVQPKIIQRGAKTFRHDLFKATVGSTLKNVGIKKYQPELVKVEHVHFFHSHDAKGQGSKHTTAAVGHFHEVEQYIDPATGYPAVKCGPALRKVQKRMKNGFMKSFIEPVTFEDGNTGQTVTDSHTHEFEYLGSEELSPDKNKQRQKQDAEALRAMMGSAYGQGEIIDNTPRSNGKAEDLELSGAGAVE
jgi:hypothetical protein